MGGGWRNDGGVQARFDDIAAGGVGVRSPATVIGGAGGVVARVKEIVIRLVVVTVVVDGVAVDVGIVKRVRKQQVFFSPVV